MQRRSGITLVELLVTIAVLAMVMALLAFPILSAFGYIQKATARSAAQQAGMRAVQAITRDLETATYVFDLPIDGSAVTVTHVIAGANYASSTADASLAGSLGMSMYFSGSVVVDRYARMLDFPFTLNSAGTAWQPLLPDYQAVTDSAISSSLYSAQYTSYYRPTSSALTRPNPYILGHLQTQTNSWASAEALAFDGLYQDRGASYPLRENRYAVLAANKANKGLLWRLVRNDIINLTPNGADWDLPVFQASPLRIQNEALSPVTAPENGLPVAVMARYPLWCGRNRDIDDLLHTGVSSAWLGPVWHAASFDALDVAIRQAFPLFPLNTDPTTNTNPYGYQLRVFDSNGGIVYGTTTDAATRTTVLRTTTNGYLRHFMDWPAIDRPAQLQCADTAKTMTSNLASWTAEDIVAQRYAGKLVFAQPAAPEQLVFQTYHHGTPYTMPTFVDRVADPGNTYVSKWENAATGMPSIAYRVRLVKGGVVKTFTRAAKSDPTLLKTGEFCPLNVGVPGVVSRQIALGDDLDGTWTVDYQGQVRPVLYTLCDLQPTDTVVASYATRAVLDLIISVSRRDAAGGSPEASRQDYTTKLRVEARNAIKRAHADENTVF